MRVGLEYAEVSHSQESLGGGVGVKDDTRRVLGNGDGVVEVVWDGVRVMTVLSRVSGEQS
jgi:hypothetical protein